MTKDDVAEYFLAMIRPLLAQPAIATCEASRDDLGVLLSLRVAQPDFGRVIGRHGETIRDFRSIVRTVGLTHGMRVSVKVPEDY